MVLTYHLQNEHGTLRLWHKEIIRGSTEKEEPKTNTNIQVKHKNYLMFKNKKCTNSLYTIKDLCMKATPFKR